MSPFEDIAWLCRNWQETLRAYRQLFGHMLISTAESITWSYQNWQEALSSSWQLQVKVFANMLIITVLAVLCTSYVTHSWPFGSPGARSSQEQMIKSALDSTLLQNSNVGSKSSARPNNPDRLQVCREAGDGDIVPCPPGS